MFKIISIIGTRPQFLKLATFSKHLQSNQYPINHIIINTNQHYDQNMTGGVWSLLHIPKPDYNLQINQMSHGQMTGNMLIEIENILLQTKPDMVLVYGDCDTTLAGAIAASKLHIPVAHVEAGVRSNNKEMPEEINRILTDHCSDIYFCPTQTGVDNLNKENINNQVYHTGNLQTDLLNMIKSNIHQFAPPNLSFSINAPFHLMTIHRAYNTNPSTLSTIFRQISYIKEYVIFPIHPRTKNIIKQNNIPIPHNIELIDPIDYPQMVILLSSCKKVITDSGGLQAEAYQLQKPIITLRPETEWVETITNGYNLLVNPTSLANASSYYLANLLKTHNPSHKPQSIFQPDPNKSCSQLIIDKILDYLKEN